MEFVFAFFFLCLVAGKLDYEPVNPEHYIRQSKKQAKICNYNQTRICTNNTGTVTMHSGREREKKKPTFEGKIDGQKVKRQIVFIPNYVVPVYMEVKLN